MCASYYSSVLLLSSLAATYTTPPSERPPAESRVSPRGSLAPRRTLFTSDLVSSAVLDSRWVGPMEASYTLNMIVKQHCSSLR